MQFNAQTKGTILVALSGIFYGGLGLFGTKLQMQHVSMSSMLFWRFLIGFLFLMLIYAKTIDFQTLATIKYDYKKFLFATISYSGSSLFYFVACRYIGTGMGMVIFFSYPVFVTLFTWMFTAWRLSWCVLLSLMAVMTGLFLLKGQGHQALQWTGLAFGFAAAFSFGCYIYGSKKLTFTIDTRTQSLLLCAGNALLFLIFALFSDGHLDVLHGTQSWVYALALGIIATALPVQLLLDGLKYIGAIKAAILSVLEPIVTVIVGSILLHEMIAPVQFLGISLLLAGTLIMQFEKAAEI